MSSSTALANWEWQNEVLEVADQSVYHYDEDEQRKVLNAKPWTKDVHFFKQVKISSIALLKMVMHARSGGRIEIMGLMQGKVEMGVMWVFDAFALPVEGTETRVNAQNEAYEYMVQYASQCELVGRKEKIIGWYHSHPGYGCWLSGIDVSTQMVNQQFQEPWLAIVIDPIRTIAAGKVSLGAFRTYPQGFHPPDEQEEEFESVPLNKVEDFGVHCKQYYSLNVSYFKSERDNLLLERLWNRYWINTLSTTPWLAKNAYNLDRMRDITTKTRDAHNEIIRCANFAMLARPRSAEAMMDILGPVGLGGSHSISSAAAGGGAPGDAALRKLKKAARDTSKLTRESASQALVESCKKRIFYDWNKSPAAAAAGENHLQTGNNSSTTARTIKEEVEALDVDVDLPAAEDASPDEMKTVKHELDEGIPVKEGGAE